MTTTRSAATAPTADTSAPPASAQPSAGPPTLEPTDPRAYLGRAVATCGTVIAAVHPDQLHAPTCCPDLDVHQILGHVTGVLYMLADLGRDVEPRDRATAVEGVADDAWPARWQAAAHEVQAAWTDDATLTRVIRLPWSELTGAQTMAAYTSEVTVHTWDLAQATGQSPTWDPDVLAVAYTAIRAGLPLDDRALTPFADAVPVPETAPLLTRLVAYTGRRP